LPSFVLFAGINGAGKSTFAQNEDLLAELGPVEVINPDLVTRELRSQDPALTLDAANLAAANECERRVREVISFASQSVVIETVLSSDKYRPIVTLAKQAKFEFVLIYVVLSSAEEAIRRVKRRVQAGGHDVPEDKIRSRFGKSLENLPWFWGQADTASVYFNGDAANRKPIMVAEKVSGQQSFNPSVLLPLLASR